MGVWPSEEFEMADAYPQTHESRGLDVKGVCSAGHKKRRRSSISCYDSGGLCGFYHDIFPSLSVMQTGGKFPLGLPRTNSFLEPRPAKRVTLKITATPGYRNARIVKSHSILNRLTEESICDEICSFSIRDTRVAPQPPGPSSRRYSATK